MKISIYSTLSITYAFLLLLSTSYIIQNSSTSFVANAQQDNRQRACDGPNQELPTVCPGFLIVIKIVEGGTAPPSAFTMQVTGNNPSQSTFQGSEEGTTISLSQGPYQVNEISGPTGYTSSFSQDCSDTIAPDQTKTCTVINTYESSANPCNECFVTHLTSEQIEAYEQTLLGSGIATIEDFCDVSDTNNFLVEDAFRDVLKDLTVPPQVIEDLISCLREAGIVFR